MSAEIIQLSDHRPADTAEVDLLTAVDVVLRDLRELQTHSETESLRERLFECEQLLAAAYAASCD